MTFKPQNEQLSMLLAELNQMNESHKMLQINMMCLENENENEQNTFERQLQMFEMSSVA